MGCPDGSSPIAAGVVPTVTQAGVSFRVKKTSATGTVFTIEHLGGGYARTCDAPGSGGCGKDSSW
jgi:hypothetical protein